MNAFEMVVLIIAIVTIGKVVSARYGIDAWSRGSRRRNRDGAAQPDGVSLEEASRMKSEITPVERAHSGARTARHRSLEASVGPDRRARPQALRRLPMLPTDPLFVLSISCLIALGLIVAVAAWSWKSWLQFRQHELDLTLGQLPRRAGGDIPAVANRIDLADLRERVKKLEAIAAGVYL